MFRKIGLVFLLSMVFLIPCLSFSNFALADTDDTSAMDIVTGGLTTTGEEAGFDAEPQEVTDLVGGVITALLGLLGIAIFGYFVYGGFLYLTSQGAPDTIKKAKGILTNTIIGLLIILAAYAISLFILTQLSTVLS